MKVVLNYDLPEEKEAWTKAMDGHKYHKIVWDYLEFLKDKTKYNQDEIEAQHAEVFRAKLIELMEENKVSLF